MAGTEPLPELVVKSSRSGWQFALATCLTVLSGIGIAAGTAPSSSAPGQSVDRLAIVGATVIDGNGGAPLEGAIVLIEGDTIVALGSAAAMTIPADTPQIDATGKFVVPGLIDTNVHLSLYGGNTNERYESLVRYEHRQHEVVLEAAQLQLKYGVTTVRDSYGVLPPLIRVRDSIERGEVVGPRMLVAGNIVGWGGPFSITFSLIPEADLSPFQERMNDLIAQDVGEDLVDLTPEELRAAIGRYLDKGVDFVKYGGTGHFSRPALIGFSPAQQRAIVKETHRHSKVAETHATSVAGLRMAVEAGIDLIQHPEILGPREIPDDLVDTIVRRGVICSMLVNTMTGDAWQRHLESRERALAAQAERGDPLTGHQANPLPRQHTSAELRRAAAEAGEGLEMRRRNAIKLIEGGCITTIGTDNYRAAAPELARGPKPENQDHGIGSILAIEGLVELGMTPAEAIVAATRNGAMASRGLDRFGTIEPGKQADLLILDADPLADIRNIRALDTVMKGGVVVDTERLPENPIFYRAAAGEGRTRCCARTGSTRRVGIVC